MEHDCRVYTFVSFYGNFPYNPTLENTYHSPHNNFNWIFHVADHFLKLFILTDERLTPTPRMWKYFLITSSKSHVKAATYAEECKDEDEQTHEFTEH